MADGRKDLDWKQSRACFKVEKLSSMKPWVAVVRENYGMIFPTEAPHWPQHRFYVNRLVRKRVHCDSKENNFWQKWSLLCRQRFYGVLQILNASNENYNNFFCFTELDRDCWTLDNAQWILMSSLKSHWRYILFAEISRHILVGLVSREWITCYTFRTSCSLKK